MQKCFHEFTILHSCIAAVCEDHKIIAVTQVFLDAERVFHVPVEFVQVDVRKYLARHIADGDTARRFKSTLSLSLSLCAPNTHICVIAIDHCLEEPHRNIIIDPPAEDMEKCFVIDGIEEFADIPAPEETIAILCKALLCSFDCCQ